MQVGCKWVCGWVQVCGRQISQSLVAACELNWVCDWMVEAIVVVVVVVVEVVVWWWWWWW